jgi:glycosyltransferase involved in cell wall biosynthesis
VTERLRILALAPNSWDGLWMNRQQLLSRLVPSNTVLYSNGSWFTWDRGREDYRHAPLFGRFMLKDGVWVDEPPRLLLRNFRLRIVDNGVMRIHSERWKRWLSRDGGGALVLHIFHPMFASYARFIDYDVLVYHPYDWLEGMPGWNGQLESDEKALLRTADLVIVPSDFLAQQLGKKEKCQIRVLYNGVDLSMFADNLAKNSEVPPDLAPIPRPRVGYIGSPQPYLDFELIGALARKHRDWQFVFVGIERHAERCSGSHFSECDALENVHLLGTRDRSQIARYAANMDVNIIPWKAEDAKWVEAGYPAKLHEYLAAGSPVVSADLHSIRAFSAVVRIARGHVDWEAAIIDALTRGARGDPSRYHARRSFSPQWNRAHRAW